MNSFFSIEGPVYKFFTVLYHLLVLNFLWILFSLPIITIGASTTALFYVCGRYVRKEGVYVWEHFLKGFKESFKKATIIWMILLSVFLIIGLNMRNSYLLGEAKNLINILQLVVLFQLMVISIYVFPMLSRFDTKIIYYFKNAFYMGIKHLPTTILIIITLLSVIITTYLTGFFILIFMSTYVWVSSYLFQRIFKEYF